MENLEMMHLWGWILLLTQSSMVGCIWKAFEKTSNSLFTHQILGLHSMKECRYVQIYYFWTFSEEESIPTEYDDNEYCTKDMFLDCFRNYFKAIFHRC